MDESERQASVMLLVSCPRRDHLHKTGKPLQSLRQITHKFNSHPLVFLYGFNLGLAINPRFAGLHDDFHVGAHRTGLGGLNKAAGETEIADFAGHNHPAISHSELHLAGAVVARKVAAVCLFRFRCLPARCADGRLGA